MDFNRIIAGMIRAARLDKDFYEEVEHDTSYSQDALMVVVLASIAGAVGVFLGLLFRGRILAAVGSLISTAVIGVVIFFVWAFLVQIIGTRLFKGTGDFGEVRRALGFAYAPQVLNILGFIPILGGLISLAAWLWSVAAGFIATRQALDQDDTNALLTVIVAAIVAFFIQLLIGGILGLIGLAGAAVTGAFS